MGLSPMVRAPLRKRGSPLIWVDKDMVWRVPDDGRAGRPAVFSDVAILFCLSIKVLFKLPFARSIANMLIAVVMDVPANCFRWEPSWHKRCRWWGHPPHQFSSACATRLGMADACSPLSHNAHLVWDRRKTSC